MANFKKIAQDVLTLSPLMSGRVQKKTEDIIGIPVTLIAFDFAEITDKGIKKSFPVFLMAEFPDCYLNGGTLLMKMAQAWAAEFPSVEDASEALGAEGGVRIMARSGSTKSGNNLTTIDILD